MKTRFGGSVATTLALLLFAGLGAAQQSTSAAVGVNPDAIAQSQSSSPTSADDSQVRIVRLSEITGAVEVDRGTGNGFETALLNLPIVEGCKLRTAAGFTEVEFEDGSTLRLTPFTTVEFTRLRLQPSGSTVSVIDVETGTVYVSMAKTKGNEFSLSFALDNVLLTPSSHVRLFRKGQWVSVAALHGKVTVEAPAGNTILGGKTMNFHLVDPVEVSQNQNAEGPYDGWDSDAIDYHQRYANKQGYGNTGNAYGIADMSYFGRFFSAGDCGLLWRPYFAGATWDPFTAGAWVWYPPWGYTWVSSYPWGWTAYHYGGWQYCPNFGWGWQPLGYWGRFRSIPYVPKPAPGFSRPKPPQRPRPRESQVITVNRARTVTSELAAPNRFVFRRDSAGLGVPRGRFSLNRPSQRAQQQGSLTMSVRFAPMLVVNEPGRSSSTADRSGPSAAYMGGHSGFGRPGSYSGGHASSSGYSGGHSGSGGYSGGGYSSASAGHSSGGSSSGGGGSGGGGGGGGGGHGGR